MEQEKSIYEILTDEKDSENIVLQDEDGKDIEFEQIATIAFEEGLFCILHPLGVEDIDEDEVAVFQLVEEDDGETLVTVEDDDTIEAVFNEYYRLLEEDEE